ncbi:MAG: LamG-like jellyroll fold domain-containing protein, partial [Imperialibacter sp.]
MKRRLAKSLLGLFFAGSPFFIFESFSQQIDISGLGDISISNDALGTPGLTDGTDFGNVPSATTGARILAVENLDVVTLNVSSIISDNPRFTVSGFTSGAITSLSTQPFTITFTPLGLGLESALITITSDDGFGNSTYEFNIAASAVDHFETAAAGDWSDLATWGSATTLPTSSDDVIIYHDVTLDINAIVNDYTLDFVNFDFGTFDLEVLGDLVVGGVFQSQPGAVLSLTASGPQSLDFGCEEVQTVVFGGSGIKSMTGSGFDVQELLWIRDDAVLQANGIRIALEQNANWLEEDNGYFDPGYDYHTTYLRGTSHNITTNTGSRFGYLQVSADVTFNTNIDAVYYIGQNDVVLSVGANTLFVKENWQFDGTNSFTLNHDPGALIDFPYPGTLYFGANGGETYPEVRITGGGNASFYGSVYFDEDLNIDDGQVNASGVYMYFTGSNGINVSSGSSFYISGSSGLTFDVGQISSDGSVLLQGWDWESFVSVSGSGFVIESAGSGAEIGAEFTSFSGLAGNGVSVLGGTVNSSFNFSNTRFSGNGTALLTFDDVEVTDPIENVEFYSGSTYNVQKLAGGQTVTFYNASGDLAGEEFENEVSGDIAWTYPANGLQFDGFDDYVEVADSPSLDITSALTLEAWINPLAAPGDYQPIIAKADPDGGQRSYALFVGTDMSLVMVVSELGTTYDALVASSRPLRIGAWQHVSGVYESGSLRVYVNGVLAGEETTGIPSSIHSGSATLNLGTYSNAENITEGTVSDALAMELDEVRIWNTARSQFDIQTDLFSELQGTETGLVAYYRFNSSDGTAVADATSNSNNGVLKDNNYVPNIADGTNDGPIWIPSGGLAPLVFAASGASVAGFTANWLPVSNASKVVVQFDVSQGFESSMDFETIDPQSGTFFVSEDLSFYIGQQLYYRVYFEDGTINSPYSEPVAFMLTPGNALSFSGNTSGEVVVVTASPSLNLSVGTWEAWVNMQALETSRIIFKNNGSGLGMYELFYNDLNSRFEVEIKVAITTYQAISSVVSSTGTWNHVAGVYDGTSLKMYFNGVLTETTAISGVIDSNPGALGLGGDPDGNISSNAIIDEVRIWNTPLLESEIQNNMFRTLTGSEAGLVAYYRFDETTGSILPDLSVNGNMGTLVNSPAWVSSDAFELDTGGPGGVVYVKSDASGNNDGTSWADAFMDLQSALAAAVEGDQIWIANGTYKPDGADPGNTSLSFIVSVNDLSIFGGFSGTESSLAERYADPSQTVLTGDLNCDDDLIFSNMLDNANNVVLINNVTGIYIDGLTITGGNAATYGGGISSSVADFTLNEVFVEYCIAGTSGGGAYVVGGDVTILNSHFQNNYATTGGGAYLNTSEPFIYRSVFQYNDAVSGGGLYLEGSNLIDNSVSYYNKFLYNGATAVTGGGVYLEESYFEAFQNLFAGNYAYDYGGAINVDNLSTFVSVNSTVADNASSDGTGGLNFSSGATIQINNTIFWGNTSVAQLASYQSINDGGAFVINHSIVQEWDKNIYSSAAANNVNGFDPMFVNSANGDYRLLLASPAIDLGNNMLLEQLFYIDIFDEDQDADYLEYAPFDLAKNERYFGVSVDIGAYEHQGNPDPVPFLYVNSSASGN